MPRAKSDAVPAGRRDCLPAPPGAGAANGEQKRHADAEKTNAFGLWRVGGKKKTSGSQGTKGKTDEKGTLALKRPTLLAFGEQEGKEKNSGSQGTKGKTVEKGTLALKRPTLLAFGEQEGKEKTPARREPKARPPKKAR